MSTPYFEVKDLTNQIDSESDSDFEIVAISNSDVSAKENVSELANSTQEYYKGFRPTTTSITEQENASNESINKSVQPLNFDDIRRNNEQNNEIVSLSNAENNPAPERIATLQTGTSANTVIEEVNNNNDIINLSDLESQESPYVIEDSPQKSLPEEPSHLRTGSSGPKTVPTDYNTLANVLKTAVNQKIAISLNQIREGKLQPDLASRQLLTELSNAKAKYSSALLDFQTKKRNLLATKTILEKKIKRKLETNDEIGVSKIQQKHSEVLNQVKELTDDIAPVSSLYMFYEDTINKYGTEVRRIANEKAQTKVSANFFDKSKEEKPESRKTKGNFTPIYKIREHIVNLYAGVAQPPLGEQSFGFETGTGTVNPYEIPKPFLKPTKAESIKLLHSLDLENNGFNIDLMNEKRILIEKANAELKKQMLASKSYEHDDIEDEVSTLDFETEKVSEPYFLPDPVLDDLISTYFNKQGMSVSFSELLKEYKDNVQTENDLTILLGVPIAVPRFLVFDDKKKYPFDFNVLKTFLESLEVPIFSKNIDTFSRIFLMFKIIGGLLIRCTYASYINYINCQDLNRQYKYSELDLKNKKTFDHRTGKFSSTQHQNQYLLLQRKMGSVEKFNKLYNFIINKLHSFEIKLKSLGFPPIPDVKTIVNFLQIYRQNILENKMSSNDRDAIKSARSLLKIGEDATASGKHITADDLNKLEQLIAEIKTANSVDEINTPPEMDCTLMKHQRIGLFRLNYLENSSSKGGILGDEMGLGKTIQMIALMLLNKHDSSNKSIENENNNNNAKSPTLIIAPVSLLHNWNFEIESKIKKEHALSVTIFHESNKPQKFEDLRKFDVVLTSYGTLFSEYRKHLPSAIDRARNTYIDFAGESRKLPSMPSISFLAKLKRPNEYISPFFEESSTFYRVILDEAHEIKNTGTGKSKACCLLSAQYRWCLTGTPVQNNVYDIYALLRFLRIRPYMKEIVFKEKIGKFLDLKKNKSLPSVSVESRRSAERHLQALVARISLRRTKETKIDGKPILQLPELNDLKVNADMGDEERLIYDQLQANIAEEARIVLNNPRSPFARQRPIFTLLLRLRQACIHYVLVKIGEIKSEIKELGDFTYDATWGICQRYVRRQEFSVSNEVNLFLQGKKTCGSCKQYKNSSQIEYLQSIYNPLCGHCVCYDCFERHCQFNHVVDEDTKNVLIKCAECSTICSKDEWISTKLFDLIFNRGITDEDKLELCFEQHTLSLIKYKENEMLLNMEDLPASCKIQQTLEIIKKIKAIDPEAKILIFCSFTYFFKILSYFITTHLKMQFTQFDGSLNIHQKSAAIDEFRDNPDCNLMFISLRAGNVGLTLTMANHVILVDPYWNPSVEDQAIGRAHRISQNKPVQVHRLLIENTVEDRILVIQQRKKALAGSILDSENMKDVTSLGRRELGYLFGLNDLDDRRVTNDIIGEADEDM